jgi:hypothetical protein
MHLPAAPHGDHRSIANPALKQAFEPQGGVRQAQGQGWRGL